MQFYCTVYKLKFREVRLDLSFEPQPDDELVFEAVEEGLPRKLEGCRIAVCSGDPNPRLLSEDSVIRGTSPIPGKDKAGSSSDHRSLRIEFLDDVLHQNTTAPSSSEVSGDEPISNSAVDEYLKTLESKLSNNQESEGIEYQSTISELVGSNVKLVGATINHKAGKSGADIEVEAHCPCEMDVLWWKNEPSKADEEVKPLDLS